MTETLEGGNPMNMSPDVFDSAEYAVSRIVWNSHLPDGNASEIRSVVRVEIHRAILAERERCISKIDDYASTHGARHEHDEDGLLVELTCQEIAKLITGDPS